MTTKKQKPTSLADNPPVELYGPEDDGWYTTRVYDWIPLCPDLKDVDVRAYLILRSLVIEKYKNPVRKLTLSTLGDLLPGVNGKENSLGRIRGVLGNLSAVGLVSTPDGDPVKTSSRPGAALKPMRIRINDLPPEGYAGWRNTESKLAFVTRPGASDGAGQNSDPESEGADSEEGVGQNFDPAGHNFGPLGQKNDPDSCADQGEPELPLVSSFGTGVGGDALAARSAPDARRASDGSSVREAEGGCAASSNDDPSPTPREPQQQAKTSSSKTRHTREQLDLVRAVRAHFPADLLNGWSNPRTGLEIPPLPDVPALSQAILDALDGDVPAADRTVEQLGARIMQRWNQHGWGEKYYQGEIDRLVGAAIAMVRPLKASDRYGCGNPRCDAGMDVDTGAPCHICPERLAARKTQRRADGVPGQRPAQAPVQHSPFRDCAEKTCRQPLAKDSTDTLCPVCRRLADEAAEDARIRAVIAAQFGTPEQRAAYCTPELQDSYGNAPF